MPRLQFNPTTSQLDLVSCASDFDNYFLKLDQTTPQSIINGNASVIEPTSDLHIANKKYVDDYTGANYVPYSGATGNVDLGDNDFSATNGDFNGNIRVPSTTFAEKFGIIYKGTTPFIHDFSYGLNAGGITPIGRNTFVGVNAGNLTMGSTATTVGQASYNNAMGAYSLYANTTGSYNNTMGSLSLYSNTTGSYNNTMGYYSLYSNTTGSSNNAMGHQSLFYNTTGSSNNAMGYQSLRYNTTGSNNNAMGAYSLYANTTGSYNNTMGYQSLRYNTTGSHNNAMGAYSLYDLEDGSSNTGVGYNTGRGITYGSGNTILGASVTGLDAGLTNNIILANGTGAIKAQHDGTGWSLTGNVKLIADNQKLLFGAGDDASITYNGTNLIINPKEVGTGIVDVLGNIKAVEVLGKHKTNDGTSAVADGTYTMGIGTTTNGTITIKDGLITALTEAT